MSPYTQPLHKLADSSTGIVPLSKRDTPPEVADAPSIWSVITDVAADQPLNPVGWIVGGYDQAGRGAARVADATGLGGATRLQDWDRDEILGGLKDIGVGAFNSVGTAMLGGLAGAGAKAVGAGLRGGSAAARAAASSDRLLRSTYRLGRRVLGGTNRLVDGLYNPLAFTRLAPRLTGGGFLGPLSSPLSALRAGNAGLAGSELLKNLGATALSSSLGPANWAAGLLAHNQMRGLEHRVNSDPSQQLSDTALGTVATADMLPYLLTRSYGGILLNGLIKRPIERNLLSPPVRMPDEVIQALSGDQDVPEDSPLRSAYASPLHQFAGQRAFGDSVANPGAYTLDTPGLFGQRVRPTDWYPARAYPTHAQ